MKFTTKTRYGMRTMVEIGKSDPDFGILQKDISKNQNISNKYLDHIILALKKAGLIENVHGKKSGYRLTRKASEISVLQIHTAFEPEIAIIKCLGNTFDCEMQKICNTYPFWEGLNTVIKDYFKSATLEDLLHSREN